MNSFSHSLIKGCSSMISHLKGERSLMKKLFHSFYCRESNKNLKHSKVPHFKTTILPKNHLTRSTSFFVAPILFFLPPFFFFLWGAPKCGGPWASACNALSVDPALISRRYIRNSLT